MALRELLAQFDLRVTGRSELAAGDRAAASFEGRLRSLAASLDLAGSAEQRFTQISRQAAFAQKAGLTSGWQDRLIQSVSRPSAGVRAVESLKSATSAVGGLWGRLAQGESVFEKIGNSWSSLLGAFVVGSATILPFTAALDRVRTLNRDAERIGVANKELEKLAFAADMADVEYSELIPSVRKLYMTLGQAARGSKESQELLEAFGLSYDSSKALMSAPDMIAKIAEQMRGIQDPTLKSSLALRLFGRGGLAMVPYLNLAPERLAEITTEFNKYHSGLITYWKDTEKVEDSIKILTFSWQQLRVSLLSAALPAITRAISGLTRLSGQLTKLNQTGALSRLVMAGLGATVLTQLPRMTAAVKTFAAAWGKPLAIALLVWAAFDEISTALQGGDSFLALLPEGMIEVEGIVVGALATIVEAFRAAGATIQDTWIKTVGSLPAPQWALEMVGAGGPADNRAKLDDTFAQERAAWNERIKSDLAKARDTRVAAQALQSGIPVMTPEAEASWAEARNWKAMGGRMGTSDRPQASVVVPAGQSVYATVNDNAVINQTFNVSDSPAAAKKSAEQIRKLTKVARAQENAASVDLVE